MRVVIFIAFLLLHCGFVPSDLPKELPCTVEPGEQVKYIATHILPLSPENGFLERIGDPQKTPLVLVIYTALTCPICAYVHCDIVPFLRKIPAFQKGRLSIILRDYPRDPVSLKASALFWMFPPKAPLFRKKVFENSKVVGGWLDEHTAKDALEKFCRIIEEDLCPAERVLLRKELTWLIQLEEQRTNGQKRLCIPENSLIKKIFERKICDKKGLGVSEIPHALLLVKNGHDPCMWTITPISDCLDRRALGMTIEKASIALEKSRGDTVKH